MPIIDAAVEFEQHGQVISTLTVCEFCGLPYVSNSHKQRTCGKQRCREKLRVITPQRVAQSRARNAAWVRLHRGVTTTNPWLCGAPPYGAVLPGAILDFRIVPSPRWPIELRNTRALHGMFTSLGLHHQHGATPFSIIPPDVGLGWRLYVRDLDTATGFASKSADAVLFGRDVGVHFGEATLLEAPHVGCRGRLRIEIEARTPVCVRNHIGATSRAVTHLRPSRESLVSTLQNTLRVRLGLQERSVEALCIDVLSDETRQVSVKLGGKYGIEHGWIGRVRFETNLVGRWLFECAERIGLGGRTAFGFGRIRVREWL